MQNTSAAKTSRIRRLFILLLVIFTVATVLPVLVGTLYTYPAEDDFSFEGGALDLYEKYGSSFIGALTRVHDYAQTNQGTYLFTFLVHFIRAFTRWGLPGLHVVMLLLYLFFIWSVWFVISKLETSRVSRFALLAAAMYMVLQAPDSPSERELFFWYTGALNYTLEYSIALLAVAFSVASIRTDDHKKRIPAVVLACVCGFLGCGGALEVAAPCCAYLGMALLIQAGNGRIRAHKTRILPFCFAVAGALINCAAPGNYIRSDSGVSPGHETLFDALRDGLTLWRDNFRALLSSPVHLLLLSFVFCVLFLCRGKIVSCALTVKRYLLLLLGSFLAMYLSLFPVAFGDHIDHFTSMRTQGMYVVIENLTLLFAVALTAQFCAERIRKPVPVRAVAGVIAALALMNCVTGWSNLVYYYHDGFACRASSDFRTGRMQHVFDARCYVLGSFAMAPKGSDVVLRFPVDTSSQSMYGMGLIEDPGWIQNRGAARIYELNSVSVYYIDPNTVP